MWHNVRFIFDLELFYSHNFNFSHCFERFFNERFQFNCYNINRVSIFLEYSVWSNVSKKILIISKLSFIPGRISTDSVICKTEQKSFNKEFKVEQYGKKILKNLNIDLKLSLFKRKVYSKYLHNDFKLEMYG